MLDSSYVQIRTQLLRSAAPLAVLFASSLALADFSPLQGSLQESLEGFLQPLQQYDSVVSVTDLEGSETYSSDTFGARFSPWLRTWAPNPQGGNRQQVDSAFLVNEGWLEYVSPDWDLRAGNQIISWGASDIVNPTDYWNAWDYTDPFSARKLPILAVKAGIHPASNDQIVGELIFTPDFGSSRLPVDPPGPGQSPTPFSLSDSRWLLGFPSRAQIGTAPGVPLLYQIAPSDFPTRWQLGGRLRFLRVDGWDFSISGADGVHDTPAIRTTEQGSFSPGLPVTVTLYPTYYREHRFGVDGSGTLGDVGTRFEVLWRAPDQDESSLGVESSFFGVAGADYLLPDRILGAQIYLNGLFVFRTGTTNAQFSPFDGIPGTDPWDRNTVALIEARITERQKLGVRWVHSFFDQDGWVDPYFESQWVDKFKTRLGADFFYGPSTGFYGQFSDNSDVTLTARLEL